VEAENYSSQSGIQTENTSDAGGGKNVGWQENGDWMDYAVNVANAGTYTVDFRVATPNTGTQFQVRKQDGTVLYTVNVPNTGGYQSWQTVSAVINLPQGQQTLRIYTNNAAGGWNINWMNFSTATASIPTPTPPPSTSIHVEAESFTSQSGIQTEQTQDAGGGQNVGWQDNNDWMDYSVNVASAGTYTVNFRVASGASGGSFQLRNSSGTSLATVNFPNTGGWQTWQTISASVTLPAGQQTLRIYTVNSGGGWNINWFDILTQGSTSTVKTAAKDTAVLSDAPVAAVQLFPNPVKDRFALKVTNELKGQMKVTITSVAGQTVKQFSVQKPQTGTTQSYLSAADLPKGEYILTLTMNGWTQTTKMIKE
jgi:endoglucanase